MLSGVQAYKRSSMRSASPQNGVQGGVQAECMPTERSSMRSSSLQNGVQGGVQAECRSSACKAADQSGEAYAVLACSLQRCCYEGKMAVPKTLFTLELRLIRNVS